MSNKTISQLFLFFEEEFAWECIDSCNDELFKVKMVEIYINSFIEKLNEETVERIV